MEQQTGGFFASRVFRGAIFSDAKWQKLGVRASNTLPFLTHPQKSLYPPKSTISRKTRLPAAPSEWIQSLHD
jgi:hypothetical protein